MELLHLGLFVSPLLKTHVIRHWNDGHSGVREFNTRVAGEKPGEWFTGYRAQPSYPGVKDYILSERNSVYLI